MMNGTEPEGRGTSMGTRDELFQQIDQLCHPRSIAIVGLPRGLKTGKLFLMALMDQQFPGPIYGVHPTAADIDGIACYPSVSAIPHPVDFAIVLVGQQHCLAAVKACAAKGVRGIVLFTAGYKETGLPEGTRLEKEILDVARAAGMRIIGPNAMGLYCPATGLSFFPQLSRRSGPVGLISHSGSLTNILGRMAPKRGIYFSKAVSLGNECDLDAADFLFYLGADSETRVIGAYIENVRNGRRFYEAVKFAAARKPVILWKVGLTPAGRQAARSHTGALGVAASVWHGAAVQGGAVQVDGFEAWADAMMGFALLPPFSGDRMAIISGPGGLAVSAAEACGREGLRLAKLSVESVRRLEKFVPAAGTSLNNPVDVGMSASLDIDIYIQAARIVAADPGVDVLTVIGIGLTPEANEHFTMEMIRARKEFQKPFLMVAVSGFDDQLAEKFCSEGVPYFESSDRAMRTWALLRSYDRRRKHSTPISPGVAATSMPPRS
jgi:acyl-CoA synthetase (NDP forming)